MMLERQIMAKQTKFIGYLAIISWLFCPSLGAFLSQAFHTPILIVLGLVFAWATTALWVGLDAHLRNWRPTVWAVFTILAGPLAVLIYVLTRPGAALDPTDPSDTNAYQQHNGQASPGALRSAAGRVYARLAASLDDGPREQTMHTARYMTTALGICVLLGWAFLTPPGTSTMEAFLTVIWALCIPAYWVMLPWWVYLDARWRRMDALPWTLLALITNVFGLVTYLVIRYPDPRACPQCGAFLTADLKRCPYCGSETEVTCPRCQSFVKPDWVYCPSCAAQLPAAPRVPQAEAARAASEPPTISVKGTVCDAVTGSPIESVEVRIDSRYQARSTATDALGKFILSGMEPRPYVLIASAAGYASESKPFTPNPSGSTRIDFSLFPVPSGCSGLRVVES